MIDKIILSGLAGSSKFGYAKNLDFFKNNNELSFKKGLNIIFAPNGSGKSTITDILAYATASKQGGISTITNKWAVDMTMERKWEGEETTFWGGVKCIHDGQPTAYCSPMQGVGLIGGTMALDDDFFSQGLEDFKNRESTGLKSIYRLGFINKFLAGEEKIPDEYAVKENYFKDRRLGYVIDELISPKISKGQKTIILDEPDLGLSIHFQKVLWELIDSGARDHDLQVIVATHSPFSLLCDAHFIELEDGYVNIAKDFISQLGSKLK